MPEIKLIQMGPCGEGVNLTKIKKYGNKAQPHYSFSVGDSLSELGPPNEHGKYTVRQLLDLLLKVRNEENVDILVGVIDIPLVDDIFSSTDHSNGAIVVSTQSGNIRATISGINSTIGAYVLMEIAAQILAIEFRRAAEIHAEPENCEKPWHTETKSCVFDYSDNLPDTEKKLLNPRLCDSCRALLSENNIRASIQQACLRIVKLTRKAVVNTLIRDSFNNRWFMLLFGGSVVRLIDNEWRDAVLPKWIPAWLHTWSLPLALMLAMLIVVLVLYRRIPSLKNLF